MNRRDFTKVVGVAVAGLAAGAKVLSAEDKPAEGGAAKAEVKKDVHVCAGRNACKGQGGCASPEARHECAKKNNCKGLGGCASGDNGCAGKNSCKGKGGCKVPVEGSHLGGAKGADKHGCGKDGCGGKDAKSGEKHSCKH